MQYSRACPERRNVLLSQTFSSVTPVGCVFNFCSSYHKILFQSYTWVSLKMYPESVFEVFLRFQSALCIRNQHIDSLVVCKPHIVHLHAERFKRPCDELQPFQKKLCFILDSPLYQHKIVLTIHFKSYNFILFYLYIINILSI